MRWSFPSYSNSPYHPSFSLLHQYLSIFIVLQIIPFSISINTLMNQYIDEWNESYEIDSTFQHNHIHHSFMFWIQHFLSLSRSIQFSVWIFISIYSIQFFNMIHSICMKFLYFTHDMIHSNRIVHDNYTFETFPTFVTLVCTWQYTLE